MPILTALTAVLAVAPPTDIDRQEARIKRECADVDSAIVSKASAHATELAKEHKKRSKAVKAIRAFARDLGLTAKTDKCFIRILDLAISKKAESERHARATLLAKLRASLTATEVRWLQHVRTERNEAIRQAKSDVAGAKYRLKNPGGPTWSARGPGFVIRYPSLESSQKKLAALERNDPPFVPVLERNMRVGAMGTLSACGVMQVIDSTAVISHYGWRDPTRRRWSDTDFWLSRYNTAQLIDNATFYPTGIFEVVGTKTYGASTIPHVRKAELDDSKLHQITQLEAEK